MLCLVRAIIKASKTSQVRIVLHLHRSLTMFLFLYEKIFYGLCIRDCFMCYFFSLLIISASWVHVKYLCNICTVLSDGFRFMHFTFPRVIFNYSFILHLIVLNSNKRSKNYINSDYVRCIIDASMYVVLCEVYMLRLGGIGVQLTLGPFCYK